MSGALPETLVILAHSSRIKELLRWIEIAGEALRPYRLITTKELHEQLREHTAMPLTSVLSGKNGGELQLAGLVPTQSVLAVIFLCDPAARHEMDAGAFVRVCNLNDLPIATNLGTALAMIPWFKAPTPLRPELAVESAEPAEAEA